MECRTDGAKSRILACMKRGWTLRRLVLTATMGLIMVGALIAQRWWREQGTPAPVPAAASPAPDLSPEERAFYRALAPRLLALAAETEELARLGEERSRNLVELSRRSNRVSSIIAALDDVLAAAPPPARFARQAGEAEANIREIEGGVTAATDAFRGFDWDALGAAVARFSAASDNIARIAADMQTTAGGASTVEAGP